MYHVCESHLNYPTSRSCPRFYEWVLSHCVTAVRASFCTCLCAPGFSPALGSYQHHFKPHSFYVFLDANVHVFLLGNSPPGSGIVDLQKCGPAQLTPFHRCPQIIKTLPKVSLPSENQHVCPLTIYPGSWSRSRSRSWSSSLSALPRPQRSSQTRGVGLFILRAGSQQQDRAEGSEHVCHGRRSGSPGTLGHCPLFLSLCP